MKISVLQKLSILYSIYEHIYNLMTDSDDIQKRIIVMDCETNGLGNGREAACLHFLQSKTQGSTNPLQTMKEIIKNVFMKIAPKTDLSLPMQEQILRAFDTIKFTNDSLDETFSDLWSSYKTGFQSIIGKSKWTEIYKNEFTVLALKTLSQTIPWKFIERKDRSGRLHFYYDSTTETPPPTHKIVDFDVTNPDHRTIVLRNCFSRHVLSTAILQYTIDDQHELHVHESPYYETYKQIAQYMHNKHVEKIHGLTEEKLQNSRHNVDSLHDKLIRILDKIDDVTIVAHNASQDKNWILESINSQIEYLEYLQDRDPSSIQHSEAIKRLYALSHRLHDITWFCTIKGSLKDKLNSVGSKDLFQLPNNELGTIYEHITNESFEGHHNALVDAYACALIYFTLLKQPKNGSIDTTHSSVYKHIPIHMNVVSRDPEAIQDSQDHDDDRSEYSTTSREDNEESQQFDSDQDNEHSESQQHAKEAQPASTSPERRDSPPSESAEGDSTSKPPKRPKTLKEIGRTYSVHPDYTTKAMQRINTLLWQTRKMLEYLELDSSKGRGCMNASSL